MGFEFIFIFVLLGIVFAYGPFAGEDHALSYNPNRKPRRNQRNT